MSSKDSRQQRYMDFLQRYNRVVVKVCYIYASEQAPFDDLYQEVCINLWQGLDSFRGESSASTWIYRMAINTCITWLRRNKRHNMSLSLESAAEIPYTGEGEFDTERYRQFQLLLSRLEPLEKAVITLWLDEHSYDEISQITGLSKSNVAVRLHRIKEKLMKSGKDLAD
ncbi:MAG: sigma-70 family RNA polymerase sigma factor [Muribaculaceae bacterium]|nr:sigma-70 family RNA polymerase sigma factor [Muribaculaceae bacterium]